MSYHDTDFFIKQEPSRKHFYTILNALLQEVSQNYANRKSYLAGRDIKLLRTTEASLKYLSSLHDNEWRICLPKIVGEYITKMGMMLEQTKICLEEDFTGTEAFLSICDVQVILEDTNDIIHYLVTEFDATAYRQKKSIFISLKNYFLKAFPNLQKDRREAKSYYDLDSIPKIHQR